MVALDFRWGAGGGVDPGAKLRDGRNRNRAPRGCQPTPGPRAWKLSTEGRIHGSHRFCSLFCRSGRPRRNRPFQGESLRSTVPSLWSRSPDLRDGQPERFDPERTAIRDTLPFTGHPVPAQSKSNGDEAWSPWISSIPIQGKECPMVSEAPGIVGHHDALECLFVQYQVNPIMTDQVHDCVDGDMLSDDRRLRIP